LLILNQKQDTFCHFKFIQVKTKDNRQHSTKDFCWTKTCQRITGTTLRQRHCVFTDNYYTSVDLYQYLLDNDTYTTGTIQMTRKKLPNALKGSVESHKLDSISLQHPMISQQYCGTTEGVCTWLAQHIIKVSQVQ